MKSTRRLILVFVLMVFGVMTAFADTGGFDRTLQVSGSVDMEITSGSGNVTVHAGAAGSVHVKATIKTQNSWFGMSASDRIHKIEQNPPIEQQGNTIRIGKIQDRDLQRNISISYDVTAPAQTKLSSHTGSGDQNISGLQLAVTVNTGSGGLTVEDLGADARLRSGSGDLKINSVKGILNAQTGSGGIRAKGVGGEIFAETGSGEIEVEQVGSGNVRAETGSGNVKLYGIKGGLQVETGSGDIRAEGEPKGDWRVGAGSGTIRLKVPAAAAFNLDARTSSGKLSTSHPITAQGTVSHNRMQGKVGGGGVLLDVHTGSGDIEIN
ncbi:MAG TPA: DUF4097 family beta strand repeat-containing protein [Candidatus Angelobacter sp.]|jgi:DUF4097 and DUF4098 domain-containing protein YvlB|nr:DUF4097 family beta strand repeat-containing protein [Candidatus Angelobacter sp.]